MADFLNGDDSGTRESPESQKGGLLSEGVLQLFGISPAAAPPRDTGVRESGRSRGQGTGTRNLGSDSPGSEGGGSKKSKIEEEGSLLKSAA